LTQLKDLISCLNDGAPYLGSIRRKQELAIVAFRIPSPDQNFEIDETRSAPMFLAPPIFVFIFIKALLNSLRGSSGGVRMSEGQSMRLVVFARA
jgi:hypothetical protein